MKQLKIKLKNCYGIKSLEHEFLFDSNGAKAYAIYAPNGLMKSSFAKTFDALAKGDKPKEERYNRQSTHKIESDGTAILKEAIYVLKAEIDISSDSPAITNILVNPANKSRYDAILVDLDKLKNKLIASFQKSSKIKKNDIEQKILEDWHEENFIACLEKIKASTTEDDLSSYEYATIFDPKAIGVINSQEFVSKANEFNERYQELFDQAGTIYLKGVFNPAKADTAFKTLDQQGFFKSGHRIHLRNESEAINKAELDQKLQAIHASIDSDEKLKKLRANLAKNAQTQALTNLIENLSSTQVEFLFEKLKKDNQNQFRKDLWSYYFSNNTEAETYLKLYAKSKAEIKHIEADSAKMAPKWTAAIELFNDRFVDMPFTLSVANHIQATLGKESAKLTFTFKDGPDMVEWSRSEIKTLSQGEKRALYLLNFIFEVEARKIASQETLFIIDDVADSFDYKNKYAIIQYLKDLCKTNEFHQIILTHNFDFFRSLQYSFVPYNRCLMVNKTAATITIVKADGIKNYFIGKLKHNVDRSNRILCATIEDVQITVSA